MSGRRVCSERIIHKGLDYRCGRDEHKVDPENLKSFHEAKAEQHPDDGLTYLLRWCDPVLDSLQPVNPTRPRRQR